MRIAPDWKDYSVIATGDGEKLERWGDLVLLRPDPQVIWRAQKPLRSYKGIAAIYERSSTGGGRWNYLRPVPEDFTVGWRELRFKLKLMGFKHTGLFPEQAVNWDRMSRLIRGAGREISVLNLFGYTGAASVACAAAGAHVCHVDGAKAMVERAGENAKLSAVDGALMLRSCAISWTTASSSLNGSSDAGADMTRSSSTRPASAEDRAARSGR